MIGPEANHALVHYTPRSHHRRSRVCASHQTGTSRHRQFQQGRRRGRLRRRHRHGGTRSLKADGFKAIINLRTAGEQGANLEQNAARAKELGLKYISIPFSPAQPDPKAVDTFLGEIANKSNQPAFVHCGSASRVGAFWLVKRVMQDGWTVEKATEEAKAIGLRGEPLEKFALDYIAAHKK